MIKKVLQVQEDKKFADMSKAEMDRYFAKTDFEILKNMDPKCIDYACNAYQQTQGIDKLAKKDIEQIDSDMYVMGTATKKEIYLNEIGEQEPPTFDKFANDVKEDFVNKYQGKENQNEFDAMITSAAKSVMEYDTADFRNAFGWSTLQAAAIVRDMYHNDEYAHLPLQTSEVVHGGTRMLTLMGTTMIDDMKKEENQPKIKKMGYNDFLLNDADEYARQICEFDPLETGEKGDLEIWTVAHDLSLLTSVMNAIDQKTADKILYPGMNETETIEL